MILTYKQITLTEDIPNINLNQDDVGTIVEIHNDGEAYEVEFFDVNSDTVAVETLWATQVKEVSEQ